jgi:hypothetical protein
MTAYVYQEYPKCLYDSSGETITVSNQNEEARMIADGYLTAEHYFQQPELPSVTHARPSGIGGIQVKKKKA